MNTNHDLSYRLYLYKTDGFERTSFSKEYERYAAIRDGDVEHVKSNLEIIKKNYLLGKGVLSDDRIRNIRYHVIISAALISRACIEGGMPHDTAYTLSDIYIQRADKCNSEEMLINLLGDIQLDFTQRMKELKKEKIISLHIRKCVDYIYDHLDEKLTIQQLSKVLELNEIYLSRLFLKETGTSLKDFVHNAKISTAENMIKYSGFSFSEIALSLGFSSQSAFISLFRKINGITPKKYRDLYGTSD